MIPTTDGIVLMCDATCGFILVGPVMALVVVMFVASVIFVLTLEE